MQLVGGSFEKHQKNSKRRTLHEIAYRQKTFISHKFNKPYESKHNNNIRACFLSMGNGSARRRPLLRLIIYYTSKNIQDLVHGAFPYKKFVC